MTGASHKDANHRQGFIRTGRVLYLFRNGTHAPSSGCAENYWCKLEMCIEEQFKPVHSSYVKIIYTVVYCLPFGDVSLSNEYNCKNECK